MNLKNYISEIVINHLRFLVYYLSPLVTENTAKCQKCFSPSFSQIALNFFPSILAMIAFFLYGTVYFVYADTDFLIFPTLATLRDSPAVMYHQIVPRLIWHQLDGAIAFANCTTVATYCAFLAKRAGFTAGRYRVISDKNKNTTIQINKQSKVEF